MGILVSTLVAASEIAASGVQLSLQPPSQAVRIGDPVDVMVLVSGLGDGAPPSLGAFDLSISFDPGVLSYDSVTFGDPTLGNLLGPVLGSIQGSALNLAGDVINLFEVSLDAPNDLDAAQPDEFVLASLRFSMMDGSWTSLALQQAILGDAFGQRLPVEVLEGATVGIVPEGRSLGVGLMLLTIAVVQKLRRRP